MSKPSVAPLESSGGDATAPIRRRRCVRCKELKSPESFSRSRQTQDGLNRRCRDCEAERRQTYTGTAEEVDPAQDVERAAGACELCGRGWKGHPRCRACTIGLGEGHLEGPGVLLGGAPYCGDCARSTLKQRPIREQAA